MPRCSRAFERIEAARGAITLTFFEYNTLAALEIFRDGGGVEAMVLEVGLGGRLDATNIIDADVAVLCSIGMDHRDWLGDTLEQIGAEKAGIFRARPAGGAGQRRHARQRLAIGCRRWRVASTRPGAISARSSTVPMAPAAGATSAAVVVCDALPPPALAGAMQYCNAATALTALSLLQVAGACERDRVVRGLRVPYGCRAAFRSCRAQPEWILDVAHNEPAAAVLAASLRGPPAAGRTYRSARHAG